MSPFLPSSGVADIPWGMAADVRVVRTDANTITLEGVDGSSKKIFVSFNTILDLSTAKTLDTDSASDYLISESGGSVSIGSGALSTLTTGYNDNSMLYLYVTDNSDHWNFSSPTVKDYRNSLIISDNAPNEAGGWMAATGEGRYARHVGWVNLGSARTMDEGDWQIASAFNQEITEIELYGEYANATSGSGWSYTDNNAGTTPRNAQVTVPEGWKLYYRVHCLMSVANDNTYCSYRLDGDSKSVDGKLYNIGPASRYQYAVGAGAHKFTPDTVEYMKTQTGAHNTSGNVNSNDEGVPTVFIERIPPPHTPGFMRTAFVLGDHNDVDETISDSPSEGDIMYYDGSEWVKLAHGTEGQVLTVVSGVPAWNS